jgi:hypothetical protein
MNKPMPDGEIDKEEAAELAALAVAEARADTRSIPHSEVRAWLLEIAEGNFNAKPPVALDTVPSTDLSPITYS